MLKVETVAVRGDEGERGLLSFANQFLSNCKHFYDSNIDCLVNFNLVKKTGYYDNERKDTENIWEYYFEKNFIGRPDQVVDWIGAYEYSYTFDHSDVRKRQICRSLINKHLHIKKEIIIEAEEFYHRKDLKNAIGVHYRGTDITIHHPKVAIERYFYEIDKILPEFGKVFFCSDEYETINIFRDRYKDALITTESKTLSDNNSIPSYKQIGEGGYQKGKDVLIESLLLSKTAFLIKCRSNVSNFSLLLNPDLRFINLACDTPSR